MRKLLSTAAIVGVLTSASLLSPALAIPDVNTTPNSWQLPVQDTSKVNSNMNITNGANNTMNIEVGNNVTGAVGTAYWKTFDVGSNATVDFKFTANNQTAINRVTGSEMSGIYGNLKTSSVACATGSCGYDKSSNVLLINPNGVIFGKGANVNMNAFTVSTLNGTYTPGTGDNVGRGSVVFKRDSSKNSNGGIIVNVGENGNFYADKNIALVSDNIVVHKGSLLKTNTTLNYKSSKDSITDDDSFGKVKLVTGDGVTFKYYNNGAIDEVTKSGDTSADKMNININGKITSGNIDIRNYSKNANSQINLAGATLMAKKAEKGNDGNIWLTASNDIVVGNSTLKTTYDDKGNKTAIDARTGDGEVLMTAGNHISLNNNSKVDAIGNVKLKTANAGTGHDVVVDKASILSRSNNVTINSANVASVQNHSDVTGKNISITGGKDARVLDSKLTAASYAGGYGAINITSNNGTAAIERSELLASTNINVTSTKGGLQVLDSKKFESHGNINLKAKNSITSGHLKGSVLKSWVDTTVDSTANDVRLTDSDIKNVLITDANANKKGGTLHLKAKKNVEISSTGAMTLADQKVEIDAGKQAILQAGATGNKDLTVKSTTTFLNQNSAGRKYATDKTQVVLRGRDVKTSGTVNLNQLKGDILAQRNVNVTLSGVDNRENGLVAEAKTGNLTVNTAGTLSVAQLISGNNMTIKADKVIKGKSYMEHPDITGSTFNGVDRSYIKVGGSKFTSNVANNNYEIDYSGTTVTENGKTYDTEHQIHYGDETLFLALKKERQNDSTTIEIPTIDDGQGGSTEGIGDITDTGKLNPGSGSGGRTGGENPDPKPDPTCSGDPSDEQSKDEKDPSDTL